MIIVITMSICSSVTFAIKENFNIPSTYKKISIPSEFKKFDAVIVEEEITYAANNSGFKKHIRIKIQNEKGLSKYKKICLPEGTDKAADMFLVPRYKTETIHYPLGAPDMIVYFEARIIKPDGSVLNIKPRDSIVKHKWVENGRTSIFCNFYYIFDDLKVGDEIDIYYAHREIFYQKSDYNVSFNNWSPYRVFFHSELPKIEFDLKIKRHLESNNKIKFSFYNNAEPHDTLYEKNGAWNDMILHWHFNNLASVGNLWNSHFYTELPFVKYYFAGDLAKSDEKNELVEYIDYPWNYALKPHIGIKRRYNGYDRNFSSVQAFNSVFKNVLASSPDTNFINRINYFHEYVNSDFKFLDDREYISGQDQLNLRVGKFINEHKLRKLSRYYFYSEIIDRFDVPYYLITIADKRIDVIDHNKFNNGYSIPGLYGLIYGDNLYYIQPKNHQFGHHMNEIPFYYEGCPIILIPQRESEEKILNLGIAYLPRLINFYTPSSNQVDNSRKINSMVNITFSENKVEFTTKLSLSGQFSTLTRGFYTHDYVDSSVSKEYYYKIYNTSNSAKLHDLKKSYEETIFPFKTNFDIKYSDMTLLKRLNDSTLSLNIENFIHHIIDKEIDINSINSYYPDFKSTDIYRYFVKTDVPIRLEVKSYDINIENSFGKYVFSISQKNENEIMIESYMQISSDQVSSKNLKDIQTISEHIYNTKKADIKLVKLTK